MKHTPTIRAELDKYIQQKGLSLAQFGQLAGMNRGIISAIVTGNKSMSVNQLDRITEAMGLPEGEFYDLFIENFVIDHPPNMRRIEPFLFRCAELDRLDEIRRVVGAIMDNLLYSPKLFEIAEGLLEQGRLEAALILYEGVAETERYQHSERLAVCQYRIFTIQVGEDQNRNLEAATLLEPFVERLDEMEQLDALKDLANVYRSLRKWDKVDKIARKMRAKAEIQYSMKHQQQSRMCDESSKKLSRPLFVYIAYADLLCSGSCEAKDDYHQALQYTYAYASLDWVLEKDEDTQHWMGLFQNWAEGNTYVYKLLSGDISVLNDYVQYIIASSDKVDKEMIVKLLNCMFAANRFQLDVNDILKRFEMIIDSFVQQPSSDMYTYQVVPEQTTRFKYELAKYYLNRGNYSYGFKYLLDVLSKSLANNKESFFIRCIRLFEQFKQFADVRTFVKYESLVSVGQREKLFYY
ncbi:DNA-binding protein [Paenibacillus polymyxa]|nr:helix-turn-helix transcriptional regulator [Paenibacillus polymyxa]OBA06223.1 DNA-binding protein [Paenibacillus polymyxa]